MADAPVAGSPRWLALEVRDLDLAREFYESILGLAPSTEREREVRYLVGDAELRLRAPGDVPRGGVHTHYALSIPRAAYDDWYDRLTAVEPEPTERRFGDARSVYVHDPDRHCVELGERADDADESESDDAAAPTASSAASDVDGLFEVVLEVEDLDDALSFYRRLGLAVVDRAAGEGRVRLSAGDVDLELWEPRLGIADGQGGVHVDWGLAVADPSMAARRVAGDALAVESVDEGVRIRDPDGHYLTLL